MGDTLQKIANLGTSIAGAASPWLGMLGGLGSIGGAIGSLFGQNNQNEAYLQAVKETNEMNYKMFQEEQQFSREMNYITNQQNRKNWQDQFNATNEYNTASAQVDRLRKAGLNANLMMSGGNAGIAQSSGMPGASASIPGAPTMQAPNAQAFTNSIDVAVDNLSQALTSTASSLSNFSQSRSIDTKTPVEVENTEADTKNKNADTEGKEIDNDWKPHEKSVQYDIDVSNATIAKANASIAQDNSFLSSVTLNDQLTASSLKVANMFIDNQTKQVLLSFLPAEKIAEIELIGVQMATEVKKGNMYSAQAKSYLASVLASYASANYYNSLTTDQNMSNRIRAYNFTQERDLMRYSLLNDIEDTKFKWQTNKGFYRSFMNSSDIEKTEYFNNLWQSCKFASDLQFNFNFNESSYQRDAKNSGWLWHRSTRAVGDGIRNIGGGILSAGWRFGGK